MDNEIIILRPHHSLCIQFFIGKGYSEEFIKGMTETIKMLDEEDPIVTLTDSCDIICGFCPNNLNGRCISQDKVCDIDNRCLDELKLNIGDKIYWKQLRTAARSKIIDKNKLINVCRRCQWSGICQK